MFSITNSTLESVSPLSCFFLLLPRSIEGNQSSRSQWKQEVKQRNSDPHTLQSPISEAQQLQMISHIIITVQ